MSCVQVKESEHAVFCDTREEKMPVMKVRWCLHSSGRVVVVMVWEIVVVGLLWGW